MGYYEKWHQMYRIASSKWTCILNNLGCVQQCVYKTEMCDIDDLQQCLMKTWFDFEQNVIEAAIDQRRDRLRSCMRE